MPVRRFITGRERTIHQVGQIQITATLIYCPHAGFWGTGGPFGEAWLAEGGSAGGVTAAIRYISHPVFPSFKTGVEFGAILQHPDLGAVPPTVFIPFGTVSPDGTGAILSPPSNPDNWASTRYTINATYEVYYELVEIREASRVFFKVKPGTQPYFKLSCGGTTLLYEPPGPPPGNYVYDHDGGLFALGRADASCFSNSLLRNVQESVWNSGPYAAAALDFHNNGPVLTQGASAKCDFRYAIGDGLPNPPSLAVGAGIGTGDWGIVSLSAAPRATSRVGSVDCNGSPNQIARITGDLRRFGGPNSDPMNLVVTINGGLPQGAVRTLTGITDSFDTSITCAGYSVAGAWSQSGRSSGTYADSANNLGEAPGQGGVGAIVEHISEAGDLAPQYFGARYKQGRDSLSIYQSAETVLCGYGGEEFKTKANVGIVDNFWVPTNATASVVGTGADKILRFAQTSTGGNVRIGWPEHSEVGFSTGIITVNRWSGYRFFRVRIRSVGSANKTTRFGTSGGGGVTASQAWDVTTGDDGEWVERTLDLFAVSANAGQVSDQCYDADVPSRIERHTYSGFTFTNLETGVVFELAWIKGVRLHDSLFNILFSRANFRLPHGVTDGLITWVPWGLPDCGQIDQIPGHVAKRPWLGWNVTLLNAPPSSPPVSSDGYQYLPLNLYPTADLPINELEGRGLLPDNTLYLDKDASGDDGPLIVQALPTYFQPSTPPGGGDSIQGGAWSSTIRFHFQALFGAQLFGAIVPASGSVEVKEKVSLSSSGSGSARASGFYATEGPWLKVIPGATPPTQQARTSETMVYRLPQLTTIPVFTPITQTPLEFAPTSIESGSWHGHRAYVRWRVVPKSGMGPDSLSHPFLGYYAKAWKKGDDIVFRRTSNAQHPNPSAFLAQVTVREQGDGRELDGASLALGAYGELRVLWHEVEDGLTGAKESVSYDDGLSWGEVAVIVEGGRMPRYGRGVGGDLGLLIPTAFLEGDGSTGTLVGRELRPNESEYSDPWTFKTDSGADLIVEDRGFDLIQRHEGPGRWILTVVFDSEEDFSEWESADDCRTWKRLV